MESFDFQELPIEIQDYILDQEYRFPSKRGLGPETEQMMLSLMQTSKGMRELNRNRFLETICRRPISRNEIIRYIEELPQTFCLFEKRVDDTPELPFEYEGYISIFRSRAHTGPYGYSMKYTQLNGNVYYWNEVGELGVGLSNYDYLGDIDYDTIIQEITDDKEPDLLTTYRILLHRLSCMNIDSEYAKTETLRHFQEHIQEMRGSIYQTLALYVYLIGNARVMNLLVKEIFLGNSIINLQPPADYENTPDPLNFKFFESLQPILTQEESLRLQEIEQQIPILIQQIRTYIGKL